MNKQTRSPHLLDAAKKLFVLFVIAQPILDLYMSLFDGYIQIAGVSLATIVRFGMVGIITLLVMLHKRRAKLTVCFLIYLVLAAVYAVIHHFNAVGFSVPLRYARYDVMGEILYLARLCLPPALIYVVYFIRPTYTDMKRMILTTSVIVSSVILLSSLFKFGYVAYNIGKEVITYNMLDWFRDAYVEWEQLTCRGLFQGTNQLSGILLIIQPFLMYICMREKKAVNWVFCAMQLVAMMNLGTRIAGLASILAFFGLCFMYFAEKVLYKKSWKGSFQNICCIVLSCVLLVVVFLNSPLKQRMDEDGLATDSVKKHSTIDMANDNTTYAERIAYIEENVGKTTIQTYYIYDVYPYAEDADFWYKMIKYVPSTEYSGNRNQRKMMMERILERDDRDSNVLWGISHTRASSFVWPERDLETHVESLGVVGTVLFFGPHLAGIAIGVWYFLKRLRYSFQFSYYVYLCCAVLGVAAGYLAGYVLHEVFPFVFLSLMVGMTINTALDVDPKEIKE